MKAVHIFIFLLLVSLVTVKGIAFEKASSSVQIGYGIGNINQVVFSYYKAELEYDLKKTGPFFLKYEYALTNRIGIGVNFSYASAVLNYHTILYDESYRTKINWQVLNILGRLNYHFLIREKWDAYVGIGLGYRNESWDYSYSPELNVRDEKANLGNFSPIGAELTIGARYLLSSHFGFYTELGVATAIFQIGLNFRF